jgi:hypothetical protein
MSFNCLPNILTTLKQLTKGSEGSILTSLEQLSYNESKSCISSHNIGIKTLSIMTTIDLITSYDTMHNNTRHKHWVSSCLEL